MSLIASYYRARMLKNRTSGVAAFAGATSTSQIKRTISTLRFFANLSDGQLEEEIVETNRRNSEASGSVTADDLVQRFSQGPLLSRRKRHRRNGDSPPAQHWVKYDFLGRYAYHLANLLPLAANTVAQ